MAEGENQLDLAGRLIQLLGDLDGAASAVGEFMHPSGQWIEARRRRRSLSDGLRFRALQRELLLRDPAPGRIEGDGPLAHRCGPSLEVVDPLVDEAEDVLETLDAIVDLGCALTRQFLDPHHRVIETVRGKADAAAGGSERFLPRLRSAGDFAPPPTQADEQPQAEQGDPRGHHRAGNDGRLRRGGNGHARHQGLH